MSIDILTKPVHVHRTSVPNEVRQAKLAIVGEAPGKREVDEGRPFIGPSGGLLFGELSKMGVARYECAVLNVSQHQPAYNEFSSFAWEGDEIQDGIAALERGLHDVQPNLVLCLGNAALHVLKHGNVAPTLKAKGYVWPSSVSNWRGSLFMSPLGYKCLAAFHPAHVLRSYGDIAYLRADLSKAVRHMRTRELMLPTRSLDVQPTLERLCARLNWIKSQRELVALDIEGGLGTMSCISFATSPRDAFIVPFTRVDGTSYWTQDEEVELWTVLSGVLSDPLVPKVLQNCLYDAFVLSYGYKCPLRGIVDDTMLKFWELLPELEKGLGVQASLLTDEPYYKDARASDGETLWSYCCKDSAVTFECNEVLTAQLNDAASMAHYRLNMRLLEPTLYMQHVGFAFDKARRDTMVRELEQQANELKYLIDETLFGYAGQDAMLKIAKDTCVFKKHPVSAPSDLLGMPKKAYEGSIMRIAQLVANYSIASKAEKGELHTLIEYGLNVDSNKQMKEVLYNTMTLPPQYKKEHGRKTTQVTADALAILNLYVACIAKNDKRASLLLDMLRLRSLKDRVQNMQLTTDDDGRVRASYNIVGSETGRFTCYAGLTGSGTNLQTITSRDRCLFKAPFEGHKVFQCDLSGADGWTVAAQLAALGDRTMLDDYLAGLKPAKVIAVMYQEGSHATKWTIESLREACKAIDKDGWEYFAFKCVQHGTNYGMSPETVQDTILKQSYKKGGTPIYVPLAKCAQFQGLYLTRYGAIRRWHARCSSILKQYGQLRSAGGHLRTFFGRRDDHATLKEFFADEPQENTTYATSLAMDALWNDPENRACTCEGELPFPICECPRSSLIIKPLHQMHDAIIGCFPEDTVELSCHRIRSYFDNELVIAGERITIPFEGAYGDSWGELTEVI